MDKKVYPTNEQITFLVAEDIRPEAAEGKFTVIGAFPSRMLAATLPLNLTADQQKDVQFSSVAILFTFGDGVGAFKVKAELISPVGKDLLADRSTVREIDQPPNSPIALIFHFRPFPIVLGEYKLRIYVDDQIYERSFSVVPPKG